MNICFPFFMLLLLAGCSDKPLVVNDSGAYSGDGTNPVYVVSHGWHTGFVVAATTIYGAVPALKERFGDTPNIEIGWGDKGFYQAKEITSGLTLQAIFWPTESVIHAVAVPANVSAYFPESEVKALCLNDKELSSLLTFLSNSFHKDASGQVVKLKNGIYGNSQFYRGVGDYSMMNTCNKWTAKGLKSTGMDISPVFKLTADSVMAYLERLDSGRAPHCSL